MSTPDAVPTPAGSPAASTPLVTDLLALARNAHANVEDTDPADSWYRLGQRNAYAHAVGLAMGPHLATEAFTVAERVTTALQAGVTHLAQLRDIANGAPTPQPMAGPALVWVGPTGFDRAHPTPAGSLEQDYGQHWGANADQRVTLRVPHGADRGLLYLYDPTWDEYAVLATDVSRPAVEATCAAAAAVDPHMDASRIAGYLSTHDAPHVPTPAPTRDTVGAGVQL